MKIRISLLKNSFFVQQFKQAGMLDFNFKKWNLILGWLSFTLGIVVYSLTVEPTVSFWDCGEYIATSARLQIGHPPGAPLYQMVGAFMAMFALGNEHVALMVNMVSAFSSAFTLLLMFWSLVMVFQKVVPDWKENTNKAKAILGASFVGTLSFAFTDSFWFNAGEAEVYAMASLFIALLFWMGLKWETQMHTPKGNRWLLAISLVVGLSFGVHFMALLAIPSVGLLYYFKHTEKITPKNFIIANVVVVAILLFIFKLLLPWTMALFGLTEVFMVNSLGLPFDSGTIFVAIALFALFYFGIQYTKKKQLVHANTVLLSLLFVFLGFSTWMMLPIRANANTVINENRPSDAREVLAYYNREQYGHNPLFYGPQFTDMFAGLDPDNPFRDKAPNYERDYTTKKYVITNQYKNAEHNSHGDHMALLPRMWSTDHAVNYMNYVGGVDFNLNPNYNYARELSRYGIDVNELSEEEYYGMVSQIEQETEKAIIEFKQGYQRGRYDNEDLVDFLRKYGNYLQVEKPSFFQNISYMVQYQFVYMYWRYLLWNFVGKQNDEQGKADQNGNWLSGIKFIDELFVISQTDLPDDYKNNKGRNTYFFLPFILALVGIWYHSKKEWKSFYVLTILFLFTGLALKVYLNERPFEPRERDYALVGSFYVFAMWIGFGVYALWEMVQKWLQPKIALPIVFVLSLLASPILLASQNWDDHNRSGRYTALANAKAYLDSCEPNAILFTIGDNDTFPLWYAQDIENYRTDVRIVNTSLLMTDWYIDQMKAKAYESEPLPISFERKHYIGDKRDVNVFKPLTENRWELKNFLEFVKSDDPNTQEEMQSGIFVNFFPTNKLRYTVDKDAVIQNKVVTEKMYDSIVSFMDIDIKGSNLIKNRMIMLDILANNNWKRPICFTGGSFGDDDYIWLKDYLQLDGLVYKLVPVKTPKTKDSSPLDMGLIDSDKMIKIIKSWDWGNGENPNIYHDPETRRNAITCRTNVARLMEQLINEGRNQDAEEIMDLIIRKMPVDYYGFYTSLEPYIIGYYKIEQKDKARKLLEHLLKKYDQEMVYFSSMPVDEQKLYDLEIATKVNRYQSLLQIAKDQKDLPHFEKIYQKFQSHFRKLDQRVRLKRYGLTVELE